MTNETWHLRATAWELLALSFRYPDEVLAEAITSGEWSEAACEVTEALVSFASSPAPAEGLSDASACAGAIGEDAASFLHTLRAEATRLFVGAPEPTCSPYEGVWRAKAEGVQPLLFVNPHSMAVERFMKSCGLGRPEGTNEPLDHVATECELLEYLALRAAGFSAPEGTPADEDLPGGSPEAAYETFLTDHARTWMPDFANALATEARLPFYREAAQLLERLMS